MATIGKDSRSGTYYIQFHDDTGARKTLRLPIRDRRTAERIRDYVEDILAARCLGVSPRPDTQRWLTEISDDVRGKLETLGLVEPVQRKRLGEYLEEWLRERAAASPRNFVRIWQRVMRHAIDCIGRDTLLTALTKEHGKQFIEYLRNRGLSPTSVRIYVDNLKAMLNDAVGDKEPLERHPWQGLTAPKGDPRYPKEYVPVDHVMRVIEYAPTTLLKLAIGLARFAGLRCPSELLPLTWSAVDWEKSTLTVVSPKTARHGKSHRITPILQPIRPFLEQAFHEAPPGQIYVFEEWVRRRQSSPTWFTGTVHYIIRQLIRKAHVPPWPKTFHNLRFSCRCDLEQQFPPLIVSQWLGHTLQVAYQHYLTTTDAMLQKAASWDWLAARQSEQPPERSSYSPADDAADDGGRGP
jgi:integrase